MSKQDDKNIYSALSIKNWICTEISPLAWSIISTRAMPEMLEYDPKYSAININQRTCWNSTQVEVISFYLRSMFDKTLPEEVLTAQTKIERHDFLGNKTSFSLFFKRLFN